MSDDPVGDAIRAARYAEAIMRRTAAPLWGDWQHDPSGESGSPNGRAETYRADITDDHHMTVFRKNPPPVYDDDDTDELTQAYAEAERLYPHPVNMDTPWSYHLHGVGHNDNPYLKFHTPYDDNPHHTGFPDRETAQRAAEAAYQTFAPGGHGPSAPDPDEEQDPFDPRLIGAQRRTAGMFDWKQQYAKPDLSWTAKTETGHAVRLLSPEAHWGAGREVEDRDANGVSDMGWSWQIHHLGDLTDEQPHPTVMNATSLGGKIHAPDHDTDPRVYSGEYLPTREHAERQLEQAYVELARKSGGQSTSHDYDIDSIMRGQDHLGPTPSSGSGDDEDYGHIFGMLQRLGMTLDTADIIRLAGDGMSWEDTMAHIDQVLAEGEPQEYNDGIEPVHSCDGCGVEPDDDRRVQHVQRGDSFLGAFCDSCIRNL